MPSQPKYNEIASRAMKHDIHMLVNVALIRQLARHGYMWRLRRKLVRRCLLYMRSDNIASKVLAVVTILPSSDTLTVERVFEKLIVVLGRKKVRRESQCCCQEHRNTGANNTQDPGPAQLPARHSKLVISVKKVCH